MIVSANAKKAPPKEEPSAVNSQKADPPYESFGPSQKSDFRRSFQPGIGRHKPNKNQGSAASVCGGSDEAARIFF